jgi:cell division protein FtsZ
MRVTVIATGIGSTAATGGFAGKLKSSPQPARGSSQTARGKLRDVTPADLQAAVDYDEPTFIRQKQAVGESTGASYRGYKGLVIDNNDLDIPTFLRRKAD